MLDKIKNSPFSFFRLDVWLFIIWSIPVFIIPSSAKNPISRLEELTWMYGFASVAGILLMVLILCKQVPFLLQFIRKTSPWHPLSLLAYLMLIVFIGSTSLYIKETVFHYQDVEIYKQKKEKTLTGKATILYAPDPSQRGGTDYVYHLKLKGHNLYWYHKGPVSVDFSKPISVRYLPHTKHIITLSQGLKKAED